MRLASERHRLGENDCSEDLNDLCGRILSSHPLILVSNRGPVEHQVSNGTPEARRGSGSVVTSFSPLARSFEFTWVSSAMSEGDRLLSRNGAGQSVRSPIPGHHINLRYVTTPRRAYHKYYNVICNPLLWFLQHYMWNPPHNPTVDAGVHDAWENGYVPVNKAFAKSVVSEARSCDSPPIVLGHDYHLYLLPEFVRRDIPDAVIQHYVHVPWPTPLYWNLIPRHIVVRICESLCMADVTGFQTPQDLRCFLDTVEEFVPEAQVDRLSNTVALDNRICRAGVYPGSIDVEDVQNIARSPRTLEYESRLRQEVGEFYHREDRPGGTEQEHRPGFQGL